MCGRYASARSRIELLEEFSVQRDQVAEPLQPDYNVAPTKPVYAVLTREARPGPSGEPGTQADRPRQPKEQARAPAKPDSGAGMARELRVVRWGLVPSWAKDISIGSRMINARAETVAEKPAFRSAFVRRRCLLPADGYYEWQQPAAGSAGRKQPYFICRADGRPLAFAAIYELWRDRQHGDDDPDAWLWTAAIITTTAPDELGEIHDRMPMVIEPASWAEWLDPENTDRADLRALLTPAMAGSLTSYPVSPAVNSVRNNGPELIKPVDASPNRPVPVAGSRPDPGPAGGAPALF
jgi:putative SOS response-associated peptidase YedK